MKILFAVVLIVACFAVFAVDFTSLKTPKSKERGAEALAETSGGAAPLDNKKRAPVVVELFTSEGCSSCPPADALLARLDREQPVEGTEVIALAQHVDYWNSLGWADPFSSHDFSARQNEYAEAFGNEGVYTPQMIVDGRAQFPGGESGKALDEIAQAAREPKTEVILTRLANTADTDDSLRLSVRIEQFPKLSEGDAADVLLAITENNLSSDVARGENAGRKLTHVGVVRTLSKIGHVGAATTTPFAVESVVPLDRAWRRENLRAVVLLQENASKRIVGASSLKLFG